MTKYSPKNSSVPKSPSSSTLVILSYVFSIIFFVGSYAVGRYLGLGYFVILVILGLPIYLGNLYAKWYLKRKSPNIKWVEILSWLNLVLWLLPPLGLFSGFATLKFNSRNSNRRQKYYVLALSAITLSLLNSAIGIYLNLRPGGF